MSADLRELCALPPGTTFDFSDMGGIEGVRKYLDAVHLDGMDPCLVQLENPLKPDSGPVPTVTISYPLHPHIMDNIVAYAERDVLLTLRATCKAICKRVDREYAHHVQVCADGHDLIFSARWLGRIPSIRFKGTISIGASYTRPEHMSFSEDVRMRVIAKAMKSGAEPDVWMRVVPASLEWFNEFMNDVHTLDMDGPMFATILPLPRKEQKDSYKRIQVDPIPVKLIRLYPDDLGYYSGFFPFTCRHLAISVQLNNPAKPSEDTFFHRSVLIPEGTEQVMMGVHLHPNLPKQTVGGGDLRYPSSLKVVAINLEIVPVNGKKIATVESLRALAFFWSKVFRNFRPGIQFYICNLHQWDDVAQHFPMSTRDYLMILFATAWLGWEAVAEGPEKVWATCGHHLKFLRFPYDFSMDANMFKAGPDGRPLCNPDGTPAFTPAPTSAHAA